MQNQISPLSETQAQILAEYVRRGATDINFLAGSLSNLRGTLKSLGATDADADAIKAFAKQLRELMKANTSLLG